MKLKSSFKSSHFQFLVVFTFSSFVVNSVFVQFNQFFIFLEIHTYYQCLGSGSVRFWLPGSKYADPRIRIQGTKYQPKNAKKEVYSQTPNLNYLKVHQVLA